MVKGITDPEDFKTLAHRSTARWPTHILGAKVTRIKIIYNDEPLLLLSGKIIGSIKDSIDEDGERQLIRDYGVQSLAKKGKKRYDVLFSSTEHRNQALVYKRLQAGGLAIEVEEWRRTIRLEPCFNCWGLDGHAQTACTKQTLCRYCGQKDIHDSRNCEYKLIPSWHFCGLCQRKGHYACDRDNCDNYINMYKKLCTSLQVNAPNKVLENSSLNMAYVDGMSSTLSLMKQIVGNPTNFTEITSKFVSGPVLGAYLAKRDAQAKATENDIARANLRKVQEAAETAGRMATTQAHVATTTSTRESIISQNVANFNRQLSMSDTVWAYGGMTQAQFSALHPAQQDDIRRQLNSQRQAQAIQQQQTQHRQFQMDANRQQATWSNMVSNGNMPVI